MTDSTPPRTLRDEIARMAWLHWLAGLNYDNAALDAPDKPDTDSYAFADNLLASFDIRPHNEPAAARVPEGMTAEKLREIASWVGILADDLPDVVALRDVVRAWADVLAARDVGGDSPAGTEKT